MFDSKGYREDSADTDDGPPPDWGGMDTIDATARLGMHSRPMSDDESARLVETIANAPAAGPLPAMAPHRGPDGWDDGTRPEPDPIADTRTHDEQVSAYRIAGRGPGLVRLDAVAPERIVWLWEGRIPLGKVTLMDGDPGLGKSTITLDNAARTTRGWSMPDGTAGIGPAGVVILTAEDGLADTVVPRLTAHGADLSRVVSRTLITDDAGPDDPGRMPSIPHDLDTLKADIEAVGAALVVIDPLMAYLGGDVNSYRDQDVRRALAPLAAMAEATGAAIVVVRHLNKSTGAAAIHRGGGSIGIAGAARSVLMVAPDPEAEEDDTNPRRILAAVKSSLAVTPPSLAYRLETVIIDSPVGPITTSRVAWEGVADYTSADLVAAPSRDVERTPRDEAEEFLRGMLGGGPVEAEVVKTAATKDGISERTLRRVKTDIGVVSQREGFGPGSVVRWSLPAHTGPREPIGVHPKDMDTYAIYEQDVAPYGADRRPDERASVDVEAAERATDDDAEDATAWDPDAGSQVTPEAPVAEATETPVSTVTPTIDRPPLACIVCGDEDLHHRAADGTYTCRVHAPRQPSPASRKSQGTETTVEDYGDDAAEPVQQAPEPMDEPMEPATVVMDGRQPAAEAPRCPQCRAVIVAPNGVCTSPDHARPGVHRVPVIDDQPAVDEEDVSQDVDDQSYGADESRLIL